jgi:transmembrane sensor
MSNGIAVSVNHGRVGVKAPQARQGLEVPLEAGDWVRVDWGGQVERGKDEPELVGGWRSGMLVVKDRPIAEVVDEIRRHYSGTIVMPETGLGRQRVTGVYDLRRPVEALRAVAQVHGANARQISPWMAVISSY